MPCLIYARYSSENQRDASIEDQIRICKARAEREGWKVAGTLSDHATSGATTLRPGYQAMLAAIRAGGIDLVLGESLDRFSRDLEHIASFFKQCTFHGVRIHTLSEGEITELHIGLKGTMGALYLKDLADKTRRGLEGRIHAGRCTGSPPYGYSVVRKLGEDGELDRGLRSIEPDRAAVVRRIFESYAGGASPRRIAVKLNTERVPGPGGDIWYESSIRGRAKRQDGILRNALYNGRIVWRRRTNSKDPSSGATVRRDAKPDSYVSVETPHLQIIDDTLWQRVQQRLAAEAAPTVSGAPQAFWDRRRPRHLLSQKVVCGACGRSFKAVGRDYLSCSAAKSGGCRNTRTVRRAALQAHVMQLLHRELMQPDMLEDFFGSMRTEYERLTNELRLKAAAGQRDRAVLDRKISNLVEAISDGRASPAILAKLAELEAAREACRGVSQHVGNVAPAFDPLMAEAYKRRIASLTAALERGDDPTGLELARALIDKVIVHPPNDENDPPEIELVGELMALLKAAEVPGAAAKPNDANLDPVLEMFVSSVKVGPGAEPLAFLPTPYSGCSWAPSIIWCSCSCSASIFVCRSAACESCAGVSTSRNCSAMARCALSSSLRTFSSWCTTEASCDCVLPAVRISVMCCSRS
jgi:site-specific DNA recombinase